MYLAKLNKKFLIGQSVDEETTAGIKRILLSRPAIEEVLNVQSQWIGPYAFSYKAEVTSGVCVECVCCVGVSVCVCGDVLGLAYRLRAL